MQDRKRHPWQVTPAEARAIQQHLRQDVKIGTYVKDIRYIAGVDVSVACSSPAVYAGVVVLDYDSLEVVERQGVVTRTNFPYIPGLRTNTSAPCAVRADEPQHRVIVKPAITIPRPASPFVPSTDCRVQFLHGVTRVDWVSFCRNCALL